MNRYEIEYHPYDALSPYDVKWNGHWVSRHRFLFTAKRQVRRLIKKRRREQKRLRSETVYWIETE